METEELTESVGGEVYLDDAVSNLKLDNQSGTVCKLQCYVKANKDANPSKIGDTSFFPLGQSGTLSLDSLPIQEGSLVTAYANVRLGKDSRACTWAVYRKGTGKTAEYTISGVINFTKVAFNGIY